jgi:hypothetical protein
VQGPRIALPEVQDDYEGNDRPRGDSYDIGAFEADPGTATIQLEGIPRSTITV